jgi:hypothetical protein
VFSLPPWVKTAEQKKKYGKAVGFGCPENLLKDQDLCAGFLESKGV